MALIICADCSQPVSTEAASCPHCGRTIKTPKSRPSGCVLFFIITAALVAAAVILILVLALDREAERLYGPEIHNRPRGR